MEYEECETGSIQQCVTETQEKCDTEETTECWEEEQRDCRTNNKCHTAYQKMCSTIQQRVCPHAPPQQVEEKKVQMKQETKKSKWKREAVDTDLGFVAVDEFKKISEEGGKGDINGYDFPERKKRSFKSLKKIVQQEVQTCS